MIIDFSVLKVGHNQSYRIWLYMLGPFSEHIVAIKRYFRRFSKSVVNFQNNQIFKIASLINKNQTFSSESWFSAPKNLMLTEI